MPFSKPDNLLRKPVSKGREARKFAQLGLDFTLAPEYSEAGLIGGELMNRELFESLDNRVTDLVSRYQALKKENIQLQEEIERYKAEKETVRSRIDVIIGKLDGI